MGGDLGAGGKTDVPITSHEEIGTLTAVSLRPVHVAREDKVAEGDGGRLARTWFMLS